MAIRLFLGIFLAVHLHAQIKVEAFDKFVQQVGGRLAPHLPATSAKYKFTLADDSRGGETHEPAATADGRIAVPAILVLTARDESEFAGMLAHAMAHIAEGHSARGRELESRADADAVKAMAAAGYDPEALIRYIERVQPRLSSRFSPLPSRQARVEAIREDIAALPRAEMQARPGNGDFAAVQQAVRKARAH